MLDESVGRYFFTSRYFARRLSLDIPNIGLALIGVLVNATKLDTAAWRVFCFSRCELLLKSGQELRRNPTQP